MTAAELRSFTRKELASMARGHEISGWHGMKKEELIKALCRKLRSQRLATPRAAGSRSAGQPAGSSTPAPARNGRLAASEKTKRRRYLSTGDSSEDASTTRDSLVAEPLDSHWIRATWTLSARQIDRARAALGADWHQAVPVIRVLDLSSSDSVSAASSAAGEHEVRTASQTIYVPVEHSGRSYVLQLACRSESGKLFVLARSNPVKVPLATEAAPAMSVAINATGRYRLPAPGRGTTTASQPADGKAFQVEASLVVRGSTTPGAEVTFFGDPVRVNEDGTFTLQLSLDEGRQVIPAVMTTSDRRERRTIVLAIERNTRELEPQPLDETGAQFPEPHCGACCHPASTIPGVVARICRVTLAAWRNCRDSPRSGPSPRAQLAAPPPAGFPPHHCRHLPRRPDLSVRVAIVYNLRRFASVIPASRRCECPVPRRPASAPYIVPPAAVTGTARDFAPANGDGSGPGDPAT